MDKTRVRLAHLITLPRGQVDRMPHQRTRPQKPEPVVDIGVVARLGKQLADPGDLLVLFGEMRLHRAGRVRGPERAPGAHRG